MDRQTDNSPDRAGSSEHDGTKSLDELLDGGTTVMLATSAPGALAGARPLTVAGVDGAVVRMLIDARTDWAAALAEGEQVLLTLSDTRGNDFGAFQGTATTSTEPALIDELWSPFAGAYFDQGRDTPGITVLSVDVTAGEYWSSPSGRIGSLVSMVRAAVGDSDASGEHGSVAT